MLKRAPVLLLLFALLLIGCAQRSPDAEPTSTAAPTEIPPTELPEEPATEATEVAPTATAGEGGDERGGSVELEQVTNAAMGIEVLVPVGWEEAAPGVYRRGESPTDVVTVIQQAAPGMSRADLENTLLGQLGIDTLPESSEREEFDDLIWDIYLVEVEVPGAGMIMVDLALSEADDTAYIVLLQTAPDEYDVFHEAVFVPALEAFTPANGSAGSEEDEEVAESVYEDPDGHFSVPVPTNWSAREEEGYVTLAAPDDEITVDILVIEGEDGESAIEEAWSVVDPDFDFEIADNTRIPPSAAGGVDDFIIITYETKPDEGEPIIQAEARIYDGQVYVLLVTMELEAVQRRSAQIQLIDSGFTISSLDEEDLSGAMPGEIDDELIAALESYITETMEQWEVPGAAVAIVRDSEVVYSEGFGVRDLESQEPVTPETLMMIGSTTKPMTTMLMAQLVDEGVIEWDTPVVEILPTFRVADEALSQEITVRNLVCACTGVPRRDFELVFNAAELDAEAIIESLAGFEFFTDFGEAFQYSNQMVATGGYIATLAAGGEYGNLYDAYVNLMEERILGPIGMPATTFSIDEAEASGQSATPYGSTLTGELVEVPLENEGFLLPVAPAGALWSNVEEMARYLITVLNRGVTPDGTRIVSEENLGETWQPQVEISADASYGLGWILSDYKGIRVISHNGNTLGFTSELAFLPEYGIGITVLSNEQGSVLNGAIRARFLELLFGQEASSEEFLQFQFDQIQEALAEVEESLLDEVDEAVIAPYLGTLANEVLGEITLTFEEGVLLADAGEFTVEIQAMENDEDEVSYIVTLPPLAGVPVKFAESEEGTPQMVIGTGLVEYTFERLSSRATCGGRAGG